MEVLLHRPLGNLFLMPFEFHNKLGLCAEAHEDMRGQCMSRQLQVSFVRRKRTFTQRNSTGRQEKTSDEMIPEFELEQITRHGGLLDQATYNLAGLDFTYKTPTRAQDGRREAGTPMALALEKRLKTTRTTHDRATESFR